MLSKLLTWISLGLTLFGLGLIATGYVQAQGPTSSGLTGQQAVTATAAALTGGGLSKSVCVEALSTNTISVFAGFGSGVTTSTGLELPPGSSWCPSLSNPNLIFVIASTTGASISWASTN